MESTQRIAGGDALALMHPVLCPSMGDAGAGAYHKEEIWLQ
jgi:hypothetical protein